VGIDAIPINEYCMSKNCNKIDTKTEFHEYQASLISVWRKKVVRLIPHSVGYNQSLPTEGAGKESSPPLSHQGSSSPNAYPG
jgi:hypothetical protein